MQGAYLSSLSVCLFAQKGIKFCSQSQIFYQAMVDRSNLFWGF